METTSRTRRAKNRCMQQSVTNERAPGRGGERGDGGSAVCLLRSRESASYSERIDRMQRANTDVLSGDVEIALGFLDLTEAAVIEDDKIRRRAEARRAYQTILKYMTRIQLTREQRSTLMQRLSRVRDRLWV